jgi:hypothetical protein
MEGTSPSQAGRTREGLLNANPRIAIAKLERDLVAGHATQLVMSLYEQSDYLFL